MKRLLLPLAALVLLCSHDMFLKLDTYFLEPEVPAEIKLYNGTFEESGNFIRRKRMADVSIVAGGARTAIDTSQWRNVDSMTVLSFRTGAPGTYVAGVSLDPWEIELAADKFNDYLASDGGADMLESRRAEGLLEQDAVEQYAKHAKVIFQVGDTKSDDWGTVLGYPIEFVPLSNPYDLHPGEELQVRLLFGGQPLANQLVLVGSVETHGHDHDGDHEHEHAHADGTTHSHTHAPDHEHAGSATAEHEHEHAHADGTKHSHAHAPDHEHAGSATAASGPDHTHEHAHADGTKHSHAHAPDHEHAGEATAAAHTHDHQHADGTKHTHAHTADHEHAGTSAAAASGPDHTHAHTHADGTTHTHEHAPDHEHADDAAAAAAAHGHAHAPTQELRTDSDGIVRVTAAHDGFWHLRTIHMVKSAAEGLTHESNWATLSFEVSHDRSHAHGAGHDHDHDHGGVPSYVYWIASLLVVGGLFFYFNRKT